jgi:proteasome accessory factor C
MGRPSAVTGFARLLAMIPWIAAHDGPTVDEVCARFDIPRKQLLADLDVLPFVGLYPYTPDQLVEVLVEDERVWIRYAPMFERPLRLTPDQALALVAAGSTLLAVPGAEHEGPLARGLDKLRGLLGITTDAAVDVVLGAASAEVLDLLQQAAHDQRPVEITYYAHNRDERTERVIEPWRVFADQGQWYVHAWCRSARGERLFRIDRIEQATAGEGRFEHAVTSDDLGVFSPDVDDPRVVLELQPGAHWVVEQYPVEAVEVGDDGLRRVTLAVSAAPWLARLLLRLGRDARVVEAPGDLGRVGADAAARILARYTDAPPT